MSTSLNSALSVVSGPGTAPRFLELYPFVDQQRGIPAVVHNLGGPFAATEVECLLRTGPILGEGLILPGEDRHTHGLVDRALRPDDDGRGRVVLRGKDIAGHPTDFRPESHEGLNQHGRLHGHVERPHDPLTLEGSLPGIFLTQCHQTGHLLFGESNFFAPPVG